MSPVESNCSNNNKAHFLLLNNFSCLLFQDFRKSNRKELVLVISSMACELATIHLMLKASKISYLAVAIIGKLWRNYLSIAKTNLLDFFQFQRQYDIYIEKYTYHGSTAERISQNRAHLCNPCPAQETEHCQCPDPPRLTLPSLQPPPHKDNHCPVTSSLIVYCK